MSNQSQRRRSQERRSSDSFDHLTDWVDEKENTNQTLKNGLLSFLKYVEKVEDEKLPGQK